MMSSVWFIEKMHLAENEDLFGLGEDRANTLWFNPLNARLKIFRVNSASNIA